MLFLTSSGIPACLLASGETVGETNLVDSAFLVGDGEILTVGTGVFDGALVGVTETAGETCSVAKGVSTIVATGVSAGVSVAIKVGVGVGVGI